MDNEYRTTSRRSSTSYDRWTILLTIAADSDDSLRRNVPAASLLSKLTLDPTFSPNTSLVIVDMAFRRLLLIAEPREPRRGVLTMTNKSTPASQLRLVTVVLVVGESSASAAGGASISTPRSSAVRIRQCGTLHSQVIHELRQGDAGAQAEAVAVEGRFGSIDVNPAGDPLRVAVGLSVFRTGVHMNVAYLGDEDRSHRQHFTGLA